MKTEKIYIFTRWLLADYMRSNSKKTTSATYFKNIKTYNNLGETKVDSVPDLTKQF